MQAEKAKYGCKDKRPNDTQGLGLNAIWLEQGQSICRQRQETEAQENQNREGETAGIPIRKRLLVNLQLGCCLLLIGNSSAGWHEQS